MYVTPKPYNDQKIFSDVSAVTMDFEKHMAFIVVRVFDKGNVQDIRNCRKYYGDTLISSILLNTRFLSKMRLYLASAIINQPIGAFRCYTLRQSNPELLPTEETSISRRTSKFSTCWGYGFGTVLRPSTVN